MSWFSRLGNVFRSDRLDRDLDVELQFHIEARIEELIARGLPPQDAAHEARRHFGNQLLLRESSREAKLFSWLESVFQDLRFGLRMLRKDAGVMTVAILSLALAIGACTAAFSLIDALILRPLPVRDPEKWIWASRRTVSLCLRSGSRILCGVAANRALVLLNCLTSFAGFRPCKQQVFPSNG